MNHDPWAGLALRYHHLFDTHEQPWRKEAACRGHDPNLWFPEDLRARGDPEAYAICWACPVRQACLNWALERSENQGIYGGISPPGRKRMAIRHRQPA